MNCQADLLPDDDITTGPCDNLATVTQLPATPGGNSINYYWVDGGDGLQVQFSANINGKPFTVSALFNVKRPVAQVSTTTGTISLDSFCNGGLLGIHFGCPSPGTPGITFSRSVTIPSGFSGTLAWVQVVNATTRVKYRTGSQLTLQGSGVLDTSFPYPEYPLGSGGTQDSPGEVFTIVDNEITVSDNFTMWVLFKPSFSNSIWVPLNRVDWMWSADATPTRIIQGNHTLNPQGVDSIQHPVWSGNVAALQYR